MLDVPGVGVHGGEHVVQGDILQAREEPGGRQEPHGDGEEPEAAVGETAGQGPLRVWR